MNEETVEEEVVSEKVKSSDVSVIDVKDDSENERIKKRNALPDAVEIAIFFVVALVIVFTYAFSVVQIKGQSMENTLFDSDRVIIRKIFFEPETYDVVIVNVHDANFTDESGQVYAVSSELDENIVKRVIATEGQTVDIDFDNGIVYVDGVETESDFAKEPTYTSLDGFSYPVTVPEGYVFVMGDNRNNSLDSRSSSVGFVDKDDIVGKVLVRISPFERFGMID